jgi:non-ribosomal peptide synthetase component F
MRRHLKRKAFTSCALCQPIGWFVNYVSVNPAEAAGARSTLRRVLTIGDALLSVTCAQLLQAIPETETHNVYGPTE